MPTAMITDTATMACDLGLSCVAGMTSPDAARANMFFFTTRFTSHTLRWFTICQIVDLRANGGGATRTYDGVIIEDKAGHARK